MPSSCRNRWKFSSLELFGNGRFFGLVLMVIVFDVAPAPGENYSRCGGSEQTALLSIEILAEETQIAVGESVELDAKGHWENGDNLTLEEAQWSVEPEGIVELVTGSYPHGDVTITGLAEGVATCTVVSDDIDASITITVVPAE